MQGPGRVSGCANNGERLNDNDFQSMLCIFKRPDIFLNLQESQVFHTFTSSPLPLPIESPCYEFTYAINFAILHNIIQLYFSMFKIIFI